MELNAVLAIFTLILGDIFDQIWDVITDLCHYSKPIDYIPPALLFHSVCVLVFALHIY